MGPVSEMSPPGRGDEMKLAAAAYPLDFFGDFSDYEAKITAWVAEGAATGADLLVFPEYGAMELASLGGRAVAGDQDLAVREAAKHHEAASAVLARLAAAHDVHILGGSGPVWHEGQLVNRAVFYGPSGVIGHQDKQIMTRFEREDWGIAPGSGLKVFETPFARVGVVICYDSEFPLLSRALSEAGAEVLLAPCCTEGFAGFMRVRVGSMARALENQCVTLQAPLVGEAAWCAGVEENTGIAGIFGPPDAGWPETGVLAEGALNVPGWVVAEVSREQIRQTRDDGVVLLSRHWPEQEERVAVPVEVIRA